jgi:hypothetical protein
MKPKKFDLEDRLNELIAIFLKSIDTAEKNKNQ